MTILSNFVCSLKTAAINKVNSLRAKRNKQVVYLCLALEELGYISGFTILDDRYICVHLRFFKNKSVIRSISLYSKPSSRIYLKKKNISGVGVGPFIKHNNFTLFSTSRGPGMLTDIELFMLGVGGEPIVTIS